MSTIKRDERRVFLIFLLPVLLIFLVVIIIPFILGIVYSFTNWTATSQNGAGLQFIGFRNYIKGLSDLSFAYSFLITVIYTILNMLVINVVAFAVALLVTSNSRGKNIYRVGFFLPNLIGGLVLGYVWQFIFNNGLPKLFMLLGLNNLAQPEYLFLANSTSSLIAIIIVGSWQYAGYIMMIYVAAIENIPTELHEAAGLDGAGFWQRLRAVTLPMVAQAFTITLFLTLVQSFKQFDVNVSLTGGGPSILFFGKPILGTELLSLKIYNSAFVENNLALGQARAVLFFLVLTLISVAQVRFNKRREIES